MRLYLKPSAFKRHSTGKISWSINSRKVCWGLRPETTKSLASNTWPLLVSTPTALPFSTWILRGSAWHLISPPVRFTTASKPSARKDDPPLNIRLGLDVDSSVTVQLQIPVPRQAVQCAVVEGMSVVKKTGKSWIFHRRQPAPDAVGSLETKHFEA